MKMQYLPVGIPEWARYIAQDSGGEFYAYEIKPEIHSDPDCGLWMNAGGGEIEFLCKGRSNAFWRASLKEV